jgi:hypothetical protein
MSKPRDLSPDEQAGSPRLRKLLARLERCAATEFEGYLDADLASAIMAEDKRELLAEVKKNLPKRLLAAVEGLSAEDRNDERAIKRVIAAEIEAFINKLGI